MRKVLILVRSSILDGARWARQHVYAWLVLGPIVLGLTYLSASRLADSVAAIRLSPSFKLALAACIWLAFIVLGLSKTSSEIYHVRNAESHFDALPVGNAAFLQAALARGAIRLVFAAIILIAARSLIIPEADLFPISLLTPLLLIIALTATCRVFGALNWIHWSHVRMRSAAAVAIGLLLASSVSAGMILVMVFSRSSVSSRSLALSSAAATALLTLTIGLVEHGRWRLADIEYARRLPSGGIRLESLPGWLGRLRSGPSGAQLARDLRLTVRGFSSAVHVVAALGVLLPVTIVASMQRLMYFSAQHPDSWLDATWLPQVMAIKGVCVLETCVIVALVPVLIAYELPHFWLERSVGTAGLDVWDAKLAYSRLISLPGCLLVCATGLASFTAPAYYTLPLVAECLWLWWMISSLAGAVAFEIPTRPGLSLVLVTTVGLAVGALTALAWPLGLLTYAQGMHSLKERGRQRARYYLLTEAE